MEAYWFSDSPFFEILNYTQLVELSKLTLYLTILFCVLILSNPHTVAFCKTVKL
jgi:hypothetical protein